MRAGRVAGDETPGIAPNRAPGRVRTESRLNAAPRARVLPVNTKVVSKSAQTSHRSRLRLWHYALGAALVWTAFIVASLVWSVFDKRRGTLDYSRHEARISFQTEMLFRFWADAHGGSAPATNNAPPGSEAARAEERAPVNPAPMLRQIRGWSPEPAGYRSHLASLEPSRPENAPDAWEAGALQALARGEAEVASVAAMDGQEYMRVMRPLVTEASCLACHGAQDSRVGDIRGGMSVSVPLSPLRAHDRSELAAQVVVDGVIWVLGLGVIGFGARRMRAHNLERARAETVLRDSEVHYRTLADSGQALIWISGLDKKCNYFNRPWLAFTGRTLDQELGDGWAEGVHPDDLDRCIQIYASAFERRESFSMDYRLRRHDGEFRWIQDDGTPRYDGQGNFLGFIGHCLDITVRKRAEEALQRSEQKYRSLFAANPQPMWVYDLETLAFLEVNDAAVLHYGYTREEFPHMTLRDIRPEEDVARLLENVAKLAPTVSDSGLWRHRKKSGEIMHVHIHSHALDYNGRPARLVQAHNVTAQRRAEVALRESETLYRSLFENLLNGFAYCRMLFEDGKPQDFIYLAVNDAFGSQTGLKDVVGRRVTEVIPGIRELDPRLFEIYGRVAMTGQPERFEVFLKALQMWFSISVYSPAREHFVAVFDVITERKEAEEKVRSQAELLDLAQDAIAVRDLDGCVLYWNKSFERLTGWSAAEAVGQLIVKLVKPDPADHDRANRMLLDEGHWNGELALETKDGRPFTIMSRWTLVRDAQGRPKSVLTINTDITEQKKLEAQFLRAQRLEGIGALASGIAHDLNNILSPVLMIAPLLRNTVSDAESREMLDSIESCAQRGANIIKQLLTFARGVPGARVPLPVGYLLRDMEKIIRETFPRDIRPRLDTSKDLWPLVGDATQIHQVLMNLCVNARDAMPDGGTLTLGAKNVIVDAAFAAMAPDAKPGPYVRVSVADTGTGIPPENLDRIFDPFFTTKEIGKGTGLGLATVLGIVRGHEGFVRVDSRLG